MLCPHCGTGINVEWNESVNEYDKTDDLIDRSVHVISCAFCPECGKFLVKHLDGMQSKNPYDHFTEWEWHRINVDEFIYPKFPSGKKLDKAIPDKYANEYKEAEKVLQVSPKACATLCRRILQNIFHDIGIQKRDLLQEIDEFSQQNNVPSELIDMLSLLRQVGNFAAHPKKSTHTGEIVEVEKGEAEVLLDVLFELFDFCFVRPQRQRATMELLRTKFNL